MSQTYTNGYESISTAQLPNLKGLATQKKLPLVYGELDQIVLRSANPEFTVTWDGETVTIYSGPGGKGHEIFEPSESTLHHCITTGHWD